MQRLNLFMKIGTAASKRYHQGIRCFPKNFQRAWVSNLFQAPFLCQNAFALHPRGLSRVGQDTGWQSAVVGHVQDFTDEPPCCKVPPRFTKSWNRRKKDTHITRFAWHSHSHTRTSSHACLALIASVRLWSSTPRFSPLHLKSLQALWNRLTQPNLYSVPWDRFLPNRPHTSHVAYILWWGGMTDRMRVVWIIFKNIMSQKPVTHRRVSAISCWHVPPTCLRCVHCSSLSHALELVLCLLQSVLALVSCSLDKSSNICSWSLKEASEASNPYQILGHLLVLERIFISLNLAFDSFLWCLEFASGKVPYLRYNPRTKCKWKFFGLKLQSCRIKADSMRCMSKESCQGQKRSKKHNTKDTKKLHTSSRWI